MRLYKTRFPELLYGNLGKRHGWSFFTNEPHPARVGPIYATRAELLADLTRYARENWGLEDATQGD